MRQRIGEVSNPRDRRSTSIMSKRIDQIVRQIIVPMGKTHGLPEITSFTMTEYDICLDFYRNVRRECPTLTSTQEIFMKTMLEMYQSNGNTKQANNSMRPAPHPVSNTGPF